MSNSFFCSQLPTSSSLTSFGNQFNSNPTGFGLSMFGRPSTQNFVGFGIQSQTPKIDITVTKMTDKFALENALGMRTNDFNISVASENLFHGGVKEIAVPDVGSLKYMCFYMAGIDSGTLSVELDNTSRFLRITGKKDDRLADVKCITPFCIDRAAPDGRRFIIDKSRIALIEGILYIEYQLESCMEFQKIF